MWMIIHIFSTANNSVTRWPSDHSFAQVACVCAQTQSSPTSWADRVVVAPATELHACPRAWQSRHWTKMQMKDFLQENSGTLLGLDSGN